MSTEPVKFEYTFGSVREYILWRVWVGETNRELWTLQSEKYRGLIYDTYSNSYECKWQANASELRSDLEWHVPHFCSLGDWARNITDILTDNRYDHLNFTDEEDQEFLFRYYTRLLLISSEILADFEQILIDVQVANSNQQATRRRSLSHNVDIHQLMQYVNTVCKHKNSSRLHYHNHHLKYWFEDSGDECRFEMPISVSRSSYDLASSPDGITVPSLESIVCAVTDSYQTVDRLFLENPEKFNEFCLLVGSEYTD